MSCTQKMTLGEFIARMKKGWGFGTCVHPQFNGIGALEAAIPVDIRDKLVTVEFVTRKYDFLAENGSSPNFHYTYTYEWIVDGFEIAVLVPNLYRRPNGFCVSYEYP